MQQFTTVDQFVAWVREHTSLGECAVCNAPILLTPFGRKRCTCSPECSRARREELRMKAGKICVTCGRPMTAAQQGFTDRRARRYANVPTWLREAEAEQAAEMAKGNGTPKK